MTDTYTEFLEAKVDFDSRTGFDIDLDDIRGIEQDAALGIELGARQGHGHRRLRATLDLELALTTPTAWADGRTRSMFEDLRLKVADDHVEVDGKASPFKAVDEDGDKFRLSTDGMFDKANCRFTSPDEFEVDDQGPTWPGKTVLRREH